ncbi:hypothetical protein GOZ98_03065 [Agrobacterium vitis]|nr:hypothetical protein [Agrobacterium vitis]
MMQVVDAKYGMPKLAGLILSVFGAFDLLTAGSFLRPLVVFCQKNIG